jgi:hypothetical protein
MRVICIKNKNALVYVNRNNDKVIDAKSWNNFRSIYRSCPYRLRDEVFSTVTLSTLIAGCISLALETFWYEPLDISSLSDQEAAIQILEFNVSRLLLSYQLMRDPSLTSGSTHIQALEFQTFAMKYYEEWCLLGCYAVWLL